MALALRREEPRPLRAAMGPPKAAEPPMAQKTLDAVRALESTELPQAREA